MFSQPRQFLPAFTDNNVYLKQYVKLFWQKQIRFKEIFKVKNWIFSCHFQKKKKTLIFVIKEEFIFQKDDTGTQRLSSVPVQHDQHCSHWSQTKTHSQIQKGALEIPAQFPIPLPCHFLYFDLPSKVVKSTKYW